MPRLLFRMFLYRHCLKVVLFSAVWLFAVPAITNLLTDRVAVYFAHRQSRNDI